MTRSTFLNWAPRALLICSLCLTCCARKTVGGGDAERSATEGAYPVDIEQAIKDEVIRDEPAVAAAPLSVARRVQSLAAEGGAFVLPASLAANDEGGVYVSDNNGKAIHYCPPQSDAVATLPPPQDGQAALKWPNTIRLWRDSIMISDNDGIKVFDTDGKFQRLLRIYIGVTNFALQQDGSIYANPSFEVGNVPRPLIVKFNPEGTLSGGMGNRINDANTAGLEDKAFIGLSHDYVFAAFQHRPLVQVYSADGKLVREFAVTHPLFEQLNTLTRDTSFVRPRQAVYRLPYYVSGASVVNDRLLLLLSLPRPEIVEYTFEGQEVGRYRGAPLTSPTVYMGFDARLAGDTYHFWMIAGDTKHVMSLLELTGRKQR